MLEQLTQFVKEQAGSVIQNNNEIPADKKEQAAQAAGSSVTEVAQQNPHEISSLQSGGNSSIAGKITDTLSQKLVGLGLGSGIAASIVPAILAKLQNGGFNFQEMFEKLKGPDGEFQLSDLKNIGDVFADDKPAAQNPANPVEPKKDEGLVDKLKNLF